MIVVASSIGRRPSLAVKALATESSSPRSDTDLGTPDRNVNPKGDLYELTDVAAGALTCRADAESIEVDRQVVAVVRRWRIFEEPQSVVLVSSTFRDIARALWAEVAGVVGDEEQVPQAVEAVRAGLCVRSSYSPAVLGISRADAQAVVLRSKSVSYCEIAQAVGYSARQVRRRLEGLEASHGITRSELLAVGSVLLAWERGGRPHNGLLPDLDLR